MERISVTQVAHQFSDLMDKVFYQGTIIELEQENKVIARISPVSLKSPLKVKNLNNFFHTLSSLTGDSEVFAQDLANIRNQISMEQSQWD